MQKRKLSFITLMLLPISWLYGAATSIRNLLFDWGILREKHFDLPVISVGNITVGGTGKTPHVEYLVEQLKNEFNVA
ncbi:MAG TPA: tetraacyldisaccharide 4'-kinase, partial [Bacteroidales bacterium]|nr:tetraacyldisaccharide 4'-kinase [Bacteroidales bacterium]